MPLPKAACPSSSWLPKPISGTGRSPWRSRSSSGRYASSSSRSWAIEAGATFTLGELVVRRRGRVIWRTRPGRAISYSMLLIACGARPTPETRGAVTSRVLQTLRRPSGCWRRSRVERCGESLSRCRQAPVEPPRLRACAHDCVAGSTPAASRGAELSLVTPESEPLQLFGQKPAEGVRALLDENGIAVHTRTYPVEARDGRASPCRRRHPGGRSSGRATLVSRAERIGGVPQTSRASFPSTSMDGWTGLPDVFAAGASDLCGETGRYHRSTGGQRQQKRSSPRPASTSGRSRSGPFCEG